VREVVVLNFGTIIHTHARRLLPLLFWTVGLLGVMGLGGCSRSLPQVTPTQTSRLTHMIAQMDRSINRHEAERLAYEALTYSRTLAARYRVTTSPWVHNFLVNIGLRDRGLCHQWADDLMVHLEALRLKSIALYPAGAYIGNYWREHNAIVVMPRNHSVPLAHAIVLDPWRHGGQLFFASVANDTRYPWQIRRERMRHRSRPSTLPPP